jgi:hypothetical protein
VASAVITAKGAAVAGTHAKWAAGLVVAKWLSVVALGGTVVTGGIVLLRQAEQQPVAPVKAGAAVHTRTPSVQPPAAEPPEHVEAAPEPALDEQAAPAESAEAPGGATPSLSPRKSATRAQPDISLEIAAMDEARAALRGGRPTEALRALDRYDAANAKGSLRVEATALRIDALLRSGQRDRAQSLADAFLARNPKSPYAARIRTLISGSSPAR